MKRFLGLGVLGVVALVMCGQRLPSAPVKERAPLESLVRPYGTTSFVALFEGVKRSSTVVIGDGKTYLGLYVHDRWGNCVAKDDIAGSAGSAVVRDDLGVEWFPPDESPYTLDVCNFGRNFNEFSIAIR